MKLTSDNLQKAGVADEIIPEPVGGAHLDRQHLYPEMDAVINRNLNNLMLLSPAEIIADRRAKFRHLGEIQEAASITG